MLSEGLWVGGRECKHLFVLGQRGENPAGESGRKTSQCQPLCVYVNQLTTTEVSLQQQLLAQTDASVRLTLSAPESCPPPAACQPRPEQTAWCWLWTTCPARWAAWSDLRALQRARLQNESTTPSLGSRSVDASPGEPTAMWHFFRWFLSWLTALPPMNTWHSRPSMAQPIAMTTEWICTAISLVGAKTRTCREQEEN